MQTKDWINIAVMAGGAAISSYITIHSTVASGDVRIKSVEASMTQHDERLNRIDREQGSLVAHIEDIRESLRKIDLKLDRIVHQ